MGEVPEQQAPKEVDKKIVHTYPLLRHSDMPEEMRQEAMELIVTACEKFSYNNELAARMVKDQMDKKFGSPFHAVIGEGFGFEISYEYSSDQMYSVVADVKSYKHFVPFCTKSSVIINKPDYLKAELVIGFPPIMESYVSDVTLVRPSLVRAICTEGKLFDSLETIWRFSPALKSNPQSCIIDFSIDFQFKSLLHSQLSHVFFDKVVKQMEGAFILEAKRRYGRESVPTHPLAVVRS